jgi:ferredoxin-type protein NapH
MSIIILNRYLILRRLVQLSVLFLFLAGNLYGWKILQGDLSSSVVFGTVPLSDPFALLQVLVTGTMVSTQALLGGGIVLFFFAVLGGRGFCSWICPVNLVTDLADSLRDKAGASEQRLQFTRNVRYWVLGLSLVLSTALGIAAFEWISPIGALHRGVIYGMGMGWTAVAAVFLFDVFAVKNGFCGHICPLGGFYSLVSRWSIVRVAHDSARCTQCMKCLEVCPEPQVLPMVGKETAFVKSGECTNCGRCVEVCPDRAMRFGIRIKGVIGKSEKEVTS